VAWTASARRVVSRWSLVDVDNKQRSRTSSGRSAREEIVREQPVGSERVSERQLQAATATTTNTQNQMRGRQQTRPRIDCVDARHSAGHVSHARPASSGKVCHDPLPSRPSLLSSLSYTARGVCSHGLDSNPGDVLRWRARPAGSDLEDHHHQRAVLAAASTHEGLFSTNPDSFHRHCGATFPKHTDGQTPMSYKQPGPDPEEEA